jgi:hypothetical protein
MRRTLSISMILLLWMPTLAALLPGSEDLRLPFCCRRHGVHHCAMDADDGGVQTAAVKAPARCGQFPAALPATTAPAFVAAAMRPEWPAMVSRIYSSVARREAARAGRLRAQVDRGPPFSSVA